MSLVNDKRPSLAILAGGASSRMGQPKENLSVLIDGEEKTFLQLLCDRLKNFDYCYISENNNQNIQIDGFETVIDKYKKIGPLGGIYSVLEKCQTKGVLFIACDMPMFSPEAAEYLIQNWLEKESKACIAIVDGKREPLAGIYTKECLGYIKEQINTSSYKLGVLLDAVCADYVDMSDYREAFTNINTREEYLRIYEIITGSKNAEAFLKEKSWSKYDRY